jgi:uncharacterized protein GlcG (DUF336 family)
MKRDTKESSMRKFALQLLLIVLGSSAGKQGLTAPPSASPAEARVSADLITRVEAIKIVEASLAACERRGEKAAAFVTDADGNLRAALSSDGLNPIGLRTATLKTASVLEFKASTRALADRLKSDPEFAAKYGNDSRYFFHPGALPIYRNGKFVAVLAVGGGHDQDESCALEALKELPWARTAP